MARGSSNGRATNPFAPRTAGQRISLDRLVVAEQLDVGMRAAR